MYPVSLFNICSGMSCQSSIPLSTSANVAIILSVNTYTIQCITWNTIGLGRATDSHYLTMCVIPLSISLPVHGGIYGCCDQYAK